MPIRHQGPIPVDDTVISEEEFDTRSKENVMRWVSAHVVSVSPRLWMPLRYIILRDRFLQQAISSLSPSSTYETLLEGVTITVGPKSDSNEPSKPDWRQVVLNDNITVVDRAEVRSKISCLYVAS